MQYPPEQVLVVSRALLHSSTVEQLTAIGNSPPLSTHKLWSALMVESSADSTAASVLLQTIGLGQVMALALAALEPPSLPLLLALLALLVLLVLRPASRPLPIESAR